MAKRTLKRFAMDMAIRISLYFAYSTCQSLEPFYRVIQPEEEWLYRYPHMESYIPMPMVWFLAITLPGLIIILFYILTGNREDLIESLSCVSLIITLNSAITCLLKVIVGRPRPDFFARCYPSGSSRGPCRGSPHLIADGRKSFPSGHSSVSFASCGFVSMYLAGKLKLVHDRGHERTSVRLCIVLLPLAVAMCIAVSRTCDYHHHWQDVTVGSILGLAVSSMCYFLYYPGLNHESSDQPWAQIKKQEPEANPAGDTHHVKLI